MSYPNVLIIYGAIFQCEIHIEQYNREQKPCHNYSATVTEIVSGFGPKLFFWDDDALYKWLQVIMIIWDQNCRQKFNALYNL